MKDILHVSAPNVYARFVGAWELHALVSVIHYDEVSPIHSSLNHYGVYGLFIQKNFPKNLTYGMKMFDAADGSIIAVEPGRWILRLSATLLTALVSLSCQFRRIICEC